MPTHADETVEERYQREHRADLARYAAMTPVQIEKITIDLHNALAQRDKLLAVVVELIESASYWSEYDVPIGIVDRMREAVKGVAE